MKNADALAWRRTLESACTWSTMMVSVLMCPQCAASYDEGTTCPRDGATLSPAIDDPMIGQEVGRYRVVSRLGAGGMGVVYRAVQRQIHSQVAIKVLSHEAASDRDALDRFFAEARAVSLIRNEHIVNVLDLSTLPDGRPYLVMELLDGRPLSQILRAGELGIPGRIQVILDVLAALSAAHDKGFLHRDIKPDNVFVSPGGRGKLLDFGIAKVQHMISLMVFTEPGIVLGTPQYMSPEQAHGAPLDARADVYAAGVLLYELMAGVRPFDSHAPFEVLRQHVEDAPVPPRVHRPDLSPMLEQVILGALAKDRALRFPDAASMRAAVLATPEARSISTRDLAVAAPPPNGADTNPDSGDSRPASESVSVTSAALAAVPDSHVVTVGIRPPRPGQDATRPELANPPSAPMPTSAALRSAQPQAIGSARPSTSTLSPPAPRWRLRGLVAAALLVGVSVAVAVGSSSGVSATASGGGSAPAPSPTSASAPTGWRTPRSVSEYQELLASPDPAIARWAKDHDPEMFVVERPRPAGAPPLDAATFYDQALARMRELAPAAELRVLNMSGITATGGLKRRSSLAIVFFSSERARRPASVSPTATWDPFCVTTFVLISGELAINHSTDCEGDRGPIPTCSVGEVLSRARAQGLPADASDVRLHYVESTAKWYVSASQGQTTLDMQVSEPCGAAATTPVTGIEVPRSKEERDALMIRYETSDAATKRWIEAHDPDEWQLDATAPKFLDDQHRLTSLNALVAYALQRAKAWAPDARLVDLDLRGVTADGELLPPSSDPSSGGEIMLEFASAMRNMPPPGISARDSWTPYCTLVFALDHNGLRLEQRLLCSDDRQITPRCEPVDVLRRLSANVRGDAEVFDLGFTENNEWTVRPRVRNSHGNLTFHRDVCNSPGNGAVPLGARAGGRGSADLDEKKDRSNGVVDPFTPRAQRPRAATPLRAPKL